MEAQSQQTQIQALPPKEKLWTKNFFLLWQGQLVSSFGDVAYEIALGFWILAVTVSTGLMGTLMAASTLPRILISPFAGVLVDRADRKKLIVGMDLVRGVCIVFVGVAAIVGFIQIWMVFLAGVILGICAAFFNPSISSALPDLVPASTIVQANSLMQMIHTGTAIVGNSLSGILYQVIGAPLLFLFNGISYLVSAFTELFIKIPQLERPKTDLHFWNDIKEGFKFAWQFRGIRYMMMSAGTLNFFANIAIVLFLPFFQRTEHLGPARYGFAMALLTAGSFAGMAVIAALKISPAKRFPIFIASAIISCLSFAFFPYIASFYLQLALLFVGGLTNACVNVFFTSTLQMVVPQNMRGKIFSLLGTFFSGTAPIAMAIGGVLAEFIPIKLLIFFCFSIEIFIFAPLGLLPAFRRFINFDPATQTADDIK